MKRKLTALLLAVTILASMAPTAQAASTSGGGTSDFLVDVSLSLMPARSDGLYDEPDKPLPNYTDNGFIADVDGWTPMFVATGLPVHAEEPDQSATVITDRAGLEAMTSGNYVLGADIDLTGIGWTPLSIRGDLTLDGRGYTIKGLTIDMSDKDSNGGLLGSVDGNLTVKNLRLEHGNLTMNSDSTAYYGGMIAGKVEQTLTLENIAGVHLYIKLSGSKINSVGGLIGEASGETVLRNISAEASIYRDPDLVGNQMGLGSNTYLGGLLGFSPGGILVKNCYAKTELSTEDVNCSVGGLTGGQHGQSIRYANCMVDTTIAARNTCGGLIGQNTSREATVMQVENCVVLGDLKAKQNLGGFVGELRERALSITNGRFSGTLHHVAGGLVNSQNTPSAGGLAGFCYYTTLTADSCAMDMTWSTDCSDRAAPTFEGSVGGLAGYSSASLDLQVTCCSVRLIADDQTVDSINIGGLCGRHFGSSGSASVRDTAVTCQVDLLHKNSSVAAGMIPQIGSAAFVNCGTNVDIRMEALESAHISTSGMCWNVNSKVTYAKCYAYGTIRATAGDTDVYAAGLSDCGQATQCYSGVDITVDCKSSDVAGLILNADGTPIVSSWSNASLRVKTTGTSRVGGLVQFASGNITDSCFTGNITTNNATWLGGIASRATGTVRNCYADTDLANGKYIGGIVGSDYVSATTNIYDCRFEGSIKDAGEYAAGIICYGNSGTVSGCEVDADIDCPDCFVGGIMAGNYGGTIIRDCMVSGSVAGRQVGGIAGNCYSLSIYDCTVTASVDLAVSDENTDVRGAGGIAYDALVIENCHMKTHMNIDHHGREIYVGGICAVAPAGYRCNVTNCTSRGVTCFADSGSRIGGIAGGGAGNENYLTIANCRVDGDVRLVVDGKSGDVGGIAGGTSTWIHNCVMNGDVSVFVDVPTGTAANNKGTVSAGGIAGWMSTGNDCIVSRSYHMGNVSATYSGAPAPTIYLDHPLVGHGGHITDSDFSFEGERDEETYIIRTWWHEETDTIMQPLGNVAVFVSGNQVGTTNESGELVLKSKELADNARLVVSAQKDGYRGTEKEAWFADNGVLNLYLMKKTPGKIYLKAARIYDSDNKATELLYTNNSVNISQEEQTGRKMYFEVDWNDLQTEGRTLQLVNEDGSRFMDVHAGSQTYVHLNQYFKPGDKIWLKATAYDSYGELKEAKTKLGLSIYAIRYPDFYVETESFPLGDNGNLEGIDFLNGLDFGLKGSLGDAILDTSYVNNVFKIKFGGNAFKTPKLTLLNTQLRVTLYGEIQATAQSMADSLKDAEWSGTGGLEVALDPALDYGMMLPPLAFNTEIKANVKGALTFSGEFENPDISGTLGGDAEFGIVAGLGAAASDMCIIAGPEIGAKGDYNAGLKVKTESDEAEDVDDIVIEGDVSVAVVVKGGEFFEFHPSYQLGRFKWTNKEGMKVYGLGIELNSAETASLLKWASSSRSYLAEGSGFCADSLDLLSWNGASAADPEQSNISRLYDNIMLDAESILTLENGIPVLYFTADVGDGSMSGTVSENTVLWRSEMGESGWCTPEMISVPGRFVDNVDASGPFAIWVESDETDSLSNLLTSTDVMVRANNVTSQLTQSDGYVYGTKISASNDGSKALAIWFSAPNVESAEGLLDTEGRKLWYATYNGTSWSNPREVNVGDKTIVSATPSYSQEDIFWTDEQGTMSAYHYSYTSYGGKVLSDIGMSAHDDQYTVAMTADGLSIWDDKSLKATIPTQAIELEMIHSGDHYCAVWTESDGIYYADSLGNWVRKPVVKTEQQPQELTAVMVDGMPLVSYSLSAYNSDETMLLKHLYLAKPNDLSGVDLAISAHVLDTADLERAGIARLTATVTNLREDIVSEYAYTVFEDDKQIASGLIDGLSLGYGDSDTCIVLFTPDTSAAHTYTLTVTATGDVFEENNTVQMTTVSAAQVVTTAFPAMPSGEIGLEAIVGNSGAAPVEHMTVEIYRCNTDGTTVGDPLISKDFENVPCGSYRQVILDNTYSHQFYKVVVLSDGEEVDSDMLMWQDENAVCLWVSDVSVNRNGNADVKLYAQNWAQDMNLILAVYQNGQMVASDMASLNVWEGSKSVEFDLGKLSAGAYTCKAFLVQQDSLIPLADAYTIDLCI